MQISAVSGERVNEWAINARRNDLLVGCPINIGYQGRKLMMDQGVMNFVYDSQVIKWPRCICFGTRLMLVYIQDNLYQQ